MISSAAMAGNVRKVFINSPVFTHEDEERYHYVDTEVDGSTTRRTDDELDLDELGPSVSVSRETRDQRQPGIQKVADQPRQSVRDSMLRDSLEDDHSDSNAGDRGKDGIVVADPSRYEDLMLGAGGRTAVGSSANDRPDVVPKRVDADAVPPGHYYLHDDAEEYEETQLARQHQRQEARRAHVPHLELRHSDDEPSDGEAAFDLELNEGRVPHGDHSKKKVSRGANPPRRVNFGALPHNSNSDDGSQLIDSLEFAHRHSVNGEDSRRTDNEGSSYADDRAYSNNQPHDQNNSANSCLRVYRNVQTGQHGQRYDENDQASSQRSSANRQMHHQALSHSQAHVPRYPSDSRSQGQASSQTSSNFKRRSDESAVATDFVEANRHNIKDRRQQRSYGQIHSRKKGKENAAADSERSPPQRRPVDSASSAVSAAMGAPSRTVTEQIPSSPGGQSGGSRVVSAEQLWQSRSQSLAAKKDSAQSGSGKNRRGGKAAGPPQGRVARDARAPQPPAPPQITSSAPFQSSSNVQRLSAGSFTVPVQSEMPGNSPQKVSVDINLNVVSPRPLLNQPSTSLPVQYSGPPAHEVYQYSARTQAYASSAWHHQNQTVPQPPNVNGPQSFAMFPRSTAGNSVQYTGDVVSSPLYSILPHSHSAPQSVYRQPMTQFVDAQGEVVPNQAVPQHLPIRYNYSHPQPSVADAPHHVVHPYQYQVCCNAVLNFCSVESGFDMFGQTLYDDDDR